MRHLPAPRGGKSFAGGLRGSFLLAPPLAGALALKRLARLLFLFFLPWVLSAAPLPERIEREGTLRVFVEDDFERPSSRTIYRLDTDEGQQSWLEFGSSPPERSLRTGARVRVVGLTDGETLFVERAERLSSTQLLDAEQVTSSWTTGQKKVLLIRLNFQDDTSQPYSDTTAQNTMFGAAASI